MKRDQIREFFFKEGLIRFDEQPCKKFNMRKDFDPARYQSFVNLAGIPGGLKREDVLKNLHILSVEGMMNAGVLLFGKNISDFFLQATLSCTLFQGKTKTKILDHTVYDGNIYENYNAATSYLLSHLNTEYVIKSGPREEIPELPERALREALLNALAHRDYRSTSNIQVNIFQDRVEVWNPGGLVPGLRLKDLGRVSRPRNLLLFSLMARMDLVEEVGSGIKRIRDAIAAYGLQPPIIETDSDWFSITFRRKGMDEAIEQVRRDVTPIEMDDAEVERMVIDNLLGFIWHSPGLRTAQISKAFDIPVRTMQRRLGELRDMNRIEFRGSSKTGGYFIKDWVRGGANSTINGGVNGGVKSIFEFINNNPGIRTPQLSKAMNIPAKTIEKRLNKLKDKGMIEFRGSSKTGGYHVID